jgi:hypothetical protein
MPSLIRGQCKFSCQNPDDPSTDVNMIIDTQIIAFLCPRCSYTHFEILTPVGVFRYIWHAADAERLAQMLNTPQIVDPNELH